MMELVLGWFSGLKFRFKVAGGFLVILVLAAIVGTVGYSAIVDLSSRFSIVGRSSQVTNEMQSTSLQRERYLFNPGINSATATRERVSNLTDALESLSDAVKHDPSVSANVAEVKSTVEQFSSTFDRVTAQTAQQQERLATLQHSISNLESLADSISIAVNTEEIKIRAQVDAANEELSIANGMLSSAVNSNRVRPQSRASSKRAVGRSLGIFFNRQKPSLEISSLKRENSTAAR